MRNARRFRRAFSILALLQKKTNFAPIFELLRIINTQSMTNNDMFRRIRYIFDFDDAKMIELFALADLAVTRAQVSDWLKKENDPAHRRLNDNQLAIFLNGLITDRRGKKDGPTPASEQKLNNNIILRKLKIALNLKDQDMLDILDEVGMHISKHELSAFFRHPEQRQYRPCQDQILRNFLQGMQIKYRFNQ